MKNNESLEMYLETIYTLSLKLSSVHAIDIANEMNYSKPSVSRAMKLLVNNNYISINNQGDILLTEEGLAKAKNIYLRHNILTKMLTNMGAELSLAEENACRIEHFISEEMFLIIKKYVESLDNNDN